MGAGSQEQLLHPGRPRYPGDSGNDILSPLYVCRYNISGTARAGSFLVKCQSLNIQLQLCSIVLKSSICLGIQHWDNWNSGELMSALIIL